MENHCYDCMHYDKREHYCLSKKIILTSNEELLKSRCRKFKNKKIIKLLIIKLLKEIK